MGRQLAATINGVHKIGKRLFITDETLKHRKGKKAFLTVGGVHKLVYSSGVAWEKYSCNVSTETDETYERVTPSGETKTFTAWFLTAYYEYAFHDWGGFGGGLGNANEYIDTVEKANSVDLVGMYHITTEEAWEIISVDEVSESGGKLNLKFTAKLVDQCELISSDTYNVYSKGSTSYGTVEADEGALPESGTLIEGSVADGYCVLEIDGTYYYYIVE